MAQPSSPLLPDAQGYYQHYFPRVFAYIYGRLHDTRTTEDLASQVFERAFAEVHPLPDDETFAIRLFATTRELLASHLRAQSRISTAQPRDALEDSMLKRPDLTRMLERLRQFPSREQDIIALKFDAELTNAQIAQVMGLSESNVRTILYRALRKVRKALQREG